MRVPSILLISLLISNTLFLTACNEKQEVFTEVVRPIAWIEVEKSDFTQVRRLSGSVFPLNATQLSFEVNGKVDWINVNLGDSVTKGQKLAGLEQRNLQLALNSSQANLNKAKAQYSEAKNGFKRFQILLEKKLVSISDFEKTKANYESSLSAVNLSQAQLDIAQKNLQDSILYAPYDGKVSQRNIEPSQQLSAGQTAFEIQGVKGLEVQVIVPETLIRDLQIGDKLSVQYPAFPTSTNQGYISEIGSRAKTANAFPVTVFIENPLEMLKAGMTAEVDFVFPGQGKNGYQGETIAVPIASIGAGQGQSSYVYVFDKQTKTLSKRQVTVENISNNQAQISEGLVTGDIVATAGLSFLHDGQVVRLQSKQIQIFN
ncbi:MAG: efflux RND transporter periplasmic adaptor subunit [Psychromonas sp.]|nr:efflux RND transporter periplasmic adaptor subunit [Alteromonadales bacterium]MCP5077242.1 efflux RND transporter periplasmic adaptor subunit [Psychromonas sp.]